MFNLSEMIDEIINKYGNENISKVLTPRVYINGRKNLITRCINNLLDNSVKYANKISVNLEKKNSTILISIDGSTSMGFYDDGYWKEKISKLQKELETY